MSLYQLAFSLGLALLAVAVGPALAADTSQEDNDARARRFIKAYEETIRPLEIEVNRRWWDANVSGKDEDYRRKSEAETRLEVRLSEPGPFAELKAIRQGPIGDPLVARQIAVLYLEYLPRQVDPELLKRIVALSNRRSSSFRCSGRWSTASELDRQRGPPRAARVEGLCPAPRGVGGEQAGGPAASSPSLQQTGEAPQRGRPASWASRTTTSCSLPSASRASSRC